MTASAGLNTSRPWPLWRKVVAYAVLFAVASASVWLVDRFAMRPAAERPVAGP